MPIEPERLKNPSTGWTSGRAFDMKGARAGVRDFRTDLAVLFESDYMSKEYLHLLKSIVATGAVPGRPSAAARL